MGEGHVGNFQRTQGPFAHPTFFFKFRDEFNVPLSTWEGIRGKMWDSLLLIAL